MVKTVVLDIPTNFLIGVIFALTAYPMIQRESENTIFNKFFYQSVVYALVFFVPVTAYYYYAYTDWSLVYLIDPSRVPWFYGIIFVSLYFFANILGNAWTQILIRENRKTLAIITLIISIIIVISVIALTWREYLFVGTYQEFHEYLKTGKEFSLSMKSSILNNKSFNLKLNIGGAILVIPAVVIIAKNIKDSINLKKND